MEIFKETITEITEEDRLNAYTDSIKRLAKRGLTSFATSQKQLFNMIWNSGYAPQDVLDKFGTDAKDLFIASKAAEEYQSLVFGDSYEPLVLPYEFTINADGTVAVGDKIVEKKPWEEDEGL